MKRMARWVLRGIGWRVVGDPPEIDRYVVVGAPHTSSWDLPLMLLMARARALPLRWFAKHTLFRPPLGWILRALGGIPVVRHREENLVEAAARTLREAQTLALLIAPEATKAYRDHWKSGFYHIARLASVPLVPVSIDYRRRVAEFGPPIDAGEDVDGVMQQLRAFYADHGARFPGKFGVVRLEEEGDA